MRFFGLFIALISLSGCGISARTEARNEYQVSVERYKECLVANQSRPQQCEGLRLAMEADERKFNNISAVPGSQRNANITVLSR
jgi:hypothetical protein